MVRCKERLAARGCLTIVALWSHVMCGRYRLSRRKQLIQEYFDATELNRLGRGGDHRGYIEIGPLGWPAGEDQFDLIEDPVIRSRHDPLLPA